MNKPLFIIFYLLAIVSVSCQKNIPTESSNLLVINGLFSNDSTIRVSISKSINMDDTSFMNQNFIENAEITVFENGNLVGFLPHRPSKYSGSLSPNYISPTLIPIPGNNYKIKVNVPGYPEAEATTTIPKPVNIKVMDTIWYMEDHYIVDSISHTTIPGMTPMLAINFQFTDPANEENFYLLEMDEKFEHKYGESKIIEYSNYNGVSISNAIEFYSDNPIYELNAHHGTMSFGKAFTDKAISGKTIRLRVNPAWGSTGTPQLILPPFGAVVSAQQTFYVKLYSVTKDYYQYLQTLYKYNENRKSPFYPPVQVFTNVKGGLGIFAGAGASTDSVKYNITKWF